MEWYQLVVARNGRTLWVEDTDCTSRAEAEAYATVQAERMPGVTVVVLAQWDDE